MPWVSRWSRRWTSQACPTTSPRWSRVVSSAALFSAPVKDEFFRHLPNIIITDAVGSSEGGNNGMVHDGQGPHGDEERADGHHHRAPPWCFDENLELVKPGSGVIGKIARTGDIPARVLQRPGEDGRGVHHRRRHPLRDAGRLRHRRSGRDGHAARPGLGQHQLRRGEDLPRGGRVGRPFPPRGLRRHRGRGSRRTVGTAGGGDHPAPRADRHPTLEDIQLHCREAIAGYKVPRQLHVVETIERSPSGKPDYRWAAEIVAGTPEESDSGGARTAAGNDG